MYFACEKTGFHAYVADYDEYIYGDAFKLSYYAVPNHPAEVHIFRICERRREPIFKWKHYEIHDILHWFDENKSNQKHNSTMIANANFLSYEGVPL